MTTYLVKVAAELNYWWDKEYRIQATSAATAIARAMREFRKEERIKRKRITRYRVDVTALK